MGEGPGAYRDERASLTAENARLKAELAGLHGRRRSRAQRALIAVAMVAADAWVFTVIVGLVNAPRDADVWLGWGLAVLTVGMNVAVAQRVLRSRV
jgi:hypothetical protein